MTLCLLAHFFLVRQKLRLKKKAPALTVPQMCRLLAAILPPSPVTDRLHPAQILGYLGARNTAATHASHPATRQPRSIQMRQTSLQY